MKLIALVDFTPDGIRHLKAGDPFEISDTSAKVLVSTNRAKVADEDKPKKGRYERRDMRAES